MTTRDNLSPPVLVHRVRANVFAREAEWRLEGDRLFWRAEGGDESGVMSLDNIASVRVTREPGRTGPRSLCRLRSRDGSTLLIASAHYGGVLRQEDRSASYTPLVRALTRRAAVLSPRAEFLRGASPLAWYGIVAGLASLAAALVFMALRFGAEILTGRLLLGVALVAFGLPNLLRWITANKPATFDPHNPPLP